LLAFTYFFTFYKFSAFNVERIVMMGCGDNFV